MFHYVAAEGNVSALKEILSHLHSGQIQLAVNKQGLNSIEFQQDVKQDFQQSTGCSVRLNALLKILLNSLLKFN